jgi:uncharacterized iron-regulated protein
MRLPTLPTLPALPALLAAVLLAATAAPAAAAASVLVFGELHDQPDQQRQVADEVQRLAAAGRLAAVVLEMAEAPQRTDGLDRAATEAEVRRALAWQGWDWTPYAAVVMNAVRAGVPVAGGNLPRSEMRAAMADTALDGLVPVEVRERLAQAVRDGHCGLLPDAQVPGMVRVQIARDRSLAQTVAQRAHGAPPEQTVLLLAGAQHASRDRGVPLHLARSDPKLALRVVLFAERGSALQADEKREAAQTPQEDHCENLRHSLSVPQPAATP